MLRNQEPSDDNDVTGKNGSFYPRLEKNEPGTNIIHIPGKIGNFSPVIYVEE